MECPENNYGDNTPAPEGPFLPATVKGDGGQALLASNLFAQSVLRRGEFQLKKQPPDFKLKTCQTLK